jgi:hypothetical protein
MKSLTSILAGAVVVLSPFASQAITNTAIAISGTNVVLSWPSQGYESYLVQCRPTLDPSDSWSQLTNAYPANSTNRTTFTIHGVVSSPSSGGGGTNSGGGDVPIPIPGDTNSYSGGTDTNVMPVQAGFFRVFHIPDFLADFSNYTFDGPIFIPVDYASPDAPADYVDSTTVLIGGQPTDYAQFMPYVINGVTNWGEGIYFDRLPNGTNTIQLITIIRQSDMLGDQTAYLTFSNTPVAINIGNLIFYTNWDNLILSNTYTFRAQSGVANMDWEIDIYDAYDNFVNYQSGHSDDGNIAWTWDFTDHFGNSRSNPDSDPFFYPYITITGNLGSSAQSAGGRANANTSSSGSWMPSVAAQFPSQGSWLFAYQDKYYDDGTTNYAGFDSYYLPALSNMEGGPALWKIAPWNFPLKYGTNYSQADREASWQGTTNTMGLANVLQRWTIRSFYYFGHGAPDVIGGGTNVIDSSNNIAGTMIISGSKANLRSKWVKDNVTFCQTLGAMPFRFVFLDGCNTANGGWPQAWGVPNQAEPLSYYQGPDNKTGARPSAFVGWDVRVGGNKDWGTIDKFWQFRQFWMGNWSVQTSTALKDDSDRH